MDEPDNTSVEATAEEKRPLDEARARELAQQLGRLLAEEQRQSAVDLLSQLHPVDQGEVLLVLAPEPQRELLTSLRPEEMAKILENLEPREASDLSEDIETPVLSRILDVTRPDVAADILRRLPSQQSEQVLSSMVETEEVIPLLQYPDDSAGGRMTPTHPVVKETMTTSNALDVLRLLGPPAENISSLIVVDEEGKLVGSLSVTRLALARPRHLVGDVADREVISVTPETDQEECARLMDRYSLAQLPVVDQTGQLVGIIRGEDVVNVVVEEATEDMYKMAGMAGERVFGPLRSSVLHRLPWLYVNLGTAFLAALTINLFQGTISKAVVLAVFLPVVAGQGGIGGIQTLTLVVRSMALGEITGRRGKRLLVREVILGVIHGILLGVVVALVAALWKSNPTLGLVLGLAMLGNMLIAGLMGASVPLLLRRLGMDPAVASAVIITTFTDIMGFVLFLGLAAILIDFLV